MGYRHLECWWSHSANKPASRSWYNVFSRYVSSLRHIGRSTHHRFVQEPDLSPSFEYSLKVSSTVCSSAVGACLLLLLSHFFDCLVSDNLDLSQNLVTANTKSRSLSPSPWILLLLLAASLTATALLVVRHEFSVATFFTLSSSRTRNLILQHGHP